jgi:uncharacterized protein YciI/predicted enzyme related to lactoylglutathione lyase
MSTTLFTDTRWVLAVTDLRGATRWYREVLGFSIDFEVPGWSFMSRGSCRLRLGHCPDVPPMSATPDHSWMLYLTVRGIDALYRHCREQGATLWHDLQDKPWGLREFALVTPEGHRIVIGERLPVEAAPPRHFLLFYTYAADYLQRRAALRAEHLALAEASLGRDELQLAGAYADPADGALLLFRCASDAVPRAFAAADPYVRHGLVTDWTVREWTTVVGSQAVQPRPAT